MPAATPHSQLLEAIAKRHLGVATLETRNSGDQDFYDLAVWTIRAALEEAYAAGRKRRQKRRQRMTLVEYAVIQQTAKRLAKRGDISYEEYHRRAEAAHQAYLAGKRSTT
jgi:hypothetical protein